MLGKVLESVVNNIVYRRQVKSSIIGNQDSLSLCKPFWESENMARNRKFKGLQSVFGFLKDHHLKRGDFSGLTCILK